MRRDPRKPRNTEGLASTAAPKCDAWYAPESTAELVHTASKTRSLRKDGSHVTSAFSNISWVLSKLTSSEIAAGNAEAHTSHSQTPSLAVILAARKNTVDHEANFYLRYQVYSFLKPLPIKWSSSFSLYDNSSNSSINRSHPFKQFKLLSWRL